ncbi:MAG: hypothetical protein JNL01_05995 [Bdellovibrionales bacterium]|nr:hypothetical protein [Bdellovibrionales bacterium]
MNSKLLTWTAFMVLLAGTAIRADDTAEAVKRWSGSKKESESIDLKNGSEITKGVTGEIKPVVKGKREPRRYLNKGETENRALCLEQRAQCLCPEGQYLTNLPNLDLDQNGGSASKVVITGKQVSTFVAQPKKKLIAKMGCVPTCATGSRLKFRATGKNRIEAECQAI